MRPQEPNCPHCGVRIRNEGGVVLRTAGAVLMGLSLTACPAEDDGDDTGASTAPGSTSAAGSTSADDTTGEPGTTAFASDYGGPATGDFTTGPDTTSTGGTGTGTTGTGADTETDTDAGSSTSLGGPEYGVPETTG